MPPAAAQNRKNEVQKALEHKTKSDLVASNHFYFPLKFHDNFNIAAGVYNEDARLVKDRARYFVVVLLRLADVNLDMEGYIDFDRRPAILNDDARSTMRSSLQASRIQPHRSFNASLTSFDRSCGTARSWEECRERLEYQPQRS